MHWELARLAAAKDDEGEGEDEVEDEEGEEICRARPKSQICQLSVALIKFEKKHSFAKLFSRKFRFFFRNFRESFRKSSEI